MTNQPATAAYLFHEKIDAHYINTMYEDDYSYIEKAFRHLIENFERDRQSIVTYFRDNLPEQLVHAVIKIRPAFGLAGMTRLFERCRTFENKCYLANSTGELQTEYLLLLNELDDAFQVALAEHSRLVSHITGNA